MKRSQIVIFLFGIIAALAVLCAIFPKDGLLGLRFPQLGEVLSAADRAGGLSPEELIEQRRLSAARHEFQTFFKEDPARFYLPGDDVKFFDPLFAALDRAEQTPLRIVHYGDSQIEEDRITGTIRERLQEEITHANRDCAEDFETGRLAPVRLIVLQPETYMLYRDVMIMKGTSAAQLKPINVIRNEFQRKFLSKLEEPEGSPS